MTRIQELITRGTETRDIIFCLIAALTGVAVAQLPSSNVFSGDKVHPWIRTYMDLGSVIWKFPWSVLMIGIMIALLFKTRFKGRGLSVAFCIGVGIVKTIQHAWH